MRALLTAAIGLFGLIGTVPTNAIVAGSPPDSPAARVDANTTSSAFSGVGAVLVSGVVVSGTLLTREHVLTAAHVVVNATPSQVRFQLNLGATPVFVQARAIIRHPGFIGFGLPDPSNDLAIIVLDEPAPTNARSYSVWPTALSAGQAATMVGYGGSANGDGSNPVPSDAAIKRVGTNALDSLRVGHDGSGLNQFFVFDFDGGGAPNSSGGPSLGNASETTYAVGDSGGPVLQQRAGRWQLVGINSFVTTFAGGPGTPGVFGSGGGGVLLSPYAPWIASVIADTSTPGLDAASQDIPLPAWALAVLGAGLLAPLVRRRRRLN